MALVTPAQARDWIPALTGTGEDTLLAEWVSQVERDFALMCGYPADTDGAVRMDVTEYVSIVDGPGSRNLYLPVLPVVEITAIYEDPGGDYAAATEVSSSEWTLTGRTGKVRRTSAWSPSSEAIRAEYSAGWTSAEVALISLIERGVRHRYDMRQRMGRSAVTAAGRTEQFRSGLASVGEDYPDDVMGGLGAYWLPSKLA